MLDLSFSSRFPAVYAPCSNVAAARSSLVFGLLIVHRPRSASRGRPEVATKTAAATNSATNFLLIPKELEEKVAR